MTSYKVLMVLYAIFFISCEVHSQTYSGCYHDLKDVGFDDDFNFLNYSFAMQFDRKEFEAHAKRVLNDNERTKDILAYYDDIKKTKYKSCVMTPPEYCTFLHNINSETTGKELQEGLKEFIKAIQYPDDPKDKLSTLTLHLLTKYKVAEPIASTDTHATHDKNATYYTWADVMKNVDERENEENINTFMQKPGEYNADDETPYASWGELFNSVSTIDDCECAKLIVDDKFDGNNGHKNIMRILIILLEKKDVLKEIVNGFHACSKNYMIFLVHVMNGMSQISQDFLSVKEWCEIKYPPY